MTSIKKDEKGGIREMDINFEVQKIADLIQTTLKDYSAQLKLIAQEPPEGSEDRHIQLHYAKHVLYALQRAHETFQEELWR